MFYTEIETVVRAVAKGTKYIEDVELETDLERLYNNLRDEALSMADDAPESATEYLIDEFDDEFRWVCIHIWNALPVSASLYYITEAGKLNVKDNKEQDVVDAELANFKFNLMKSWCKFMNEHMNLMSY